MKTVAHTMQFMVLLMPLFSIMPWASASGDTAAAGQGPDMIDALRAVGPHASLGSGAELLNRLVGTWDVEYSFFSKDGKVRHKSGKFLAGWVMDGRAVQDIWTVDPSADRKDREIYTSLNYFDPKSGTWYLTFIDPENASPEYPPVARFTGGPEGGNRIVFLTHDLGGKDDRTNRWSFDLGSDSFVFRDEQSSDGGKTWRLLEEDHMTQRAGNSAATVMDGVPRSSIGTG